MTNFIGKYEVKSDAKGRVFIPSVYRKVLLENENNRLVIRKDADNDCLIFFPETIWNQKLQFLKENLDEWDADDQLLLMQFVSVAEWLEIDAQGRVLISKKFQEQLNLSDNELVFVGMMDRFALWGRSNYENSMLSADDFAAKLRAKMKQLK